MIPIMTALIKWSQGNQVTLENVTKGFTIQVEAQLTQRQREMVLAGGLLNYTKTQAQ